jgi:hypothetical protein
MDIVILAIHHELSIVEFTGAMNSLYYIQEDQLYELKGDKKPIGGEQYGRERNFSKQTIQVEVPTTFYMTTDGYQDQFGGLKKEKFMKKRFKELLLKNHQKPLLAQREVLDATLNDWIEKGKEAQIDDILIIGFEL